MKIYNEVSFLCSRTVTKKYSTSFSVGVRCLDASIRNAIYAIYGFVRLADEIVDTFHGYDREKLLDRLVDEFIISGNDGISINPIMYAFRKTVNNYNIEESLVDSFLKSMRKDLYNNIYNENEIREYIYGSAESVGLMCLKVFVNGRQQEYDYLKSSAKRLGAAFQEVNFLRDIRYDSFELSRNYFPILKYEPLNERTKRLIIDDIMEDYKYAEKGIAKLPKCAKLGVNTAYSYYRKLTARLDATPAEKLMERRIRINNREKLLLLGRSYLKLKFG